MRVLCKLCIKHKLFFSLAFNNSQVAPINCDISSLSLKVYFNVNLFPLLGEHHLDKLLVVDVALAVFFAVNQGFNLTPSIKLIFKSII